MPAATPIEPAMLHTPHAHLPRRSVSSANMAVFAAPEPLVMMASTSSTSAPRDPPPRIYVKIVKFVAFRASASPSRR